MYVSDLEKASLGIERERQSKDVDIGGDRNRDKLNDSIDTI